LEIIERYHVQTCAVFPEMVERDEGTKGQKPKQICQKTLSGNRYDLYARKDHAYLSFGFVRHWEYSHSGIAIMEIRLNISTFE